MHCPFCNNNDTRVIDSRLIAEGSQTRRRRECPSCGERFTTFESAELLMPKVIKSRDNMREPFNEEKLKEGLFADLLCLLDMLSKILVLCKQHQANLHL